MIFAYWEILHFQRVVLQHAILIVLACALGWMAFSQCAWMPAFAAKAKRLGGSPAFLWSLLGVALASFIAMALWVLRDFCNSADEYSCLFLAKCLASGRFYAPAPALGDFFFVQHVGLKAGKWFSVYPPGWPLILAAGLKVGAPWLMNPLLAAASLVFLYLVGKRAGDRRVALLACAWVASSAFYLLHAGSYYSHMTCLFVLSAFVWCCLKALGDVRPTPWMFLAGLLLGYGMMTRYLSALAFGGPFILYFLYLFAAKRVLTMRDLLCFAGGAAVCNLFQFWFQYRITGNPLLTPIHFLHEHERLGFSRDFPFSLGLGQTLFRMLWYAEYVVPGFWVFAFLAFFLPRKGPWDRIFLASGLLCGAAYVLYYSFGGNQYGPRYFFESIGVLGIMAAKAYFRLWDRLAGTRRRYVLGAALVLGFVINAFNLVQSLKEMRAIVAERKSLTQAVTDAKLTNSVVFIRDWIGTRLPMPPSDLTRNLPTCDDSVLFALDLGEKNQLLMQAMPERKFYFGTYDSEAKIARLIPVKEK